MIMTKLATAAAALLLTTGLALAQAPTTTPATGAPAKAATAPKAKTTAKKTQARTPESLACSAELDAKGVHGKARKAAMSKCKKDALAAKKVGAKAPAAKK